MYGAHRDLHEVDKKGGGGGGQGKKESRQVKLPMPLHKPIIRSKSKIRSKSRASLD